MDGSAPDARFAFFLTAAGFFSSLFLKPNENSESTPAPRERDKRAASSSEGFALFASIAFTLAAFTPDASASSDGDKRFFKRLARTEFELFTSLDNFNSTHPTSGNASPFFNAFARAFLFHCFVRVSGVYLRATNRDLLLFSDAPAVRKGKPAIKHELRVLPPGKARKYAKYFTRARQYDGGKDAFSKGWLYAFVGGAEASGFISIGFDGTNAFLFNELRVNGKTFCLNEGLHKTRFDAVKGDVQIREPGLKLDWRGADACYRVRFKARKGKNELEIDYSFKRVHPKVGGYRAVFEVYDNVLARWIFSPLHGSIRVRVKGNADAFAPGLSALADKTIESDFAYCENVRALVPLASMGWHWTLLSCSDSLETPSKIVGFMDLFFGKPPGVPLNLQLYSVDLVKGTLEIYGDPVVRYSRGRVPSLSVASRDGSLSFRARKASPGAYKEIKGSRLAGLLKTADIDYRGYPSVGTAIINGKKYKAVGTSEFAGTGEGYWI